MAHRVIPKEAIDNAAFEVMRTEGFSAIKARRLAKQVGCSSQPLFRDYDSIEEIKEVAAKKAADYMSKYVFKFRETGNPFLDMGISYIRFAQEEKHLFKVLVVDNVLQRPFFDSAVIGAMMAAMQREAAQETEDPMEDAQFENMMRDVLVYTYGLAHMAYQGNIEMDAGELTEMLSGFVEHWIAGMK